VESCEILTRPLQVRRVLVEHKLMVDDALVSRPVPAPQHRHRSVSVMQSPTVSELGRPPRRASVATSPAPARRLVTPPAPQQQDNPGQEKKTSVFSPIQEAGEEAGEEGGPVEEKPAAIAKNDNNNNNNDKTNLNVTNVPAVTNLQVGGWLV